MVCAVQVSTAWLHHMIDPINGEGPNIGANDGARLLQLTNTAYRDFRPTLQLAMALFANQRAYSEDATWSHSLRWLDVATPSQVVATPNHYIADDGGFAILRRGPAMVVMRYPRFHFRPSQADALHVDLWLEGKNLLRDAGSYSYNTTPEWIDYFGGTASHNTVQFDGRDQMPRLTRFLFGDWLHTSHLERLHDDPQASSFAAGYRDAFGATHHRHIRLSDSALQVEDHVRGFREKSVLRWRLSPGSWQVEKEQSKIRLIHSLYKMQITADVPFVRVELAEGWESRHYLEKTAVPVVEIETQTPGRFNSELIWND